MRHRKLGLLLVSGLLIWVFACSLTSRSDTAAPGAQATANPQTPAAATAAEPDAQGLTPAAAPRTTQNPIQARQGDLVRDGDLRLMVHGWTEQTFAQPAASGQKYIAVDFSVVNAGQAALPIFGTHGDWSLKSSDGKTVGPYFDANTALNGPLEMSGNVYPGEKLRVRLFYQMPAAAQPVALLYANDRLPAVAPVTVTLNEAAGLADPPATLEGETAPTVLPADPPATHGNWQLQVGDVKVTQPCKQRYSTLNCRNLPADLLDVRVELVQKNVSGQSLTSDMGMFWLAEASGRRFWGTSSELGLPGKPVPGGGEIHFAADFLVWPSATDLRLGFRYHHGEKSANGDYVYLTLPPITLP